MDQLLRLARMTCRFGAWFGGVLLIAAAVVIGVEVVIRKAFSISVGGADELSGFALAIGSAWAFGFALLDRAHVRIDSLYVVLPVRVCALLDVLGLLAMTGFMSLVAYYGFNVFAESVKLGARTMSPLATPLVIPQFFWAIGLILFILTCVLLLVRALLLLVRGDAAGVRQLIGSRTIIEEVELELGEAGHRRAPREDRP